MGRKYCNLIVLILTMSLASCLPETNVVEDGALLLKSDVEAIDIPADVRGVQFQQQTVLVSCNRSWSAFFEPEVSWISLSVNEFENIARTEENTKIDLQIDNNENPSDGRETNLVISTADGRLSIPVKQGRQIPYISLSTPERVENISCMDDTYLVKFSSNISWKASIEEGATAQITLDKTEGKYDGEISLSFAENDDTEKNPEAVLVLSGEESGLSTPVKVYFKQDKASPYITWISEEPTYQSSLSGEVTVEFKTNSPWQATVKDNADGGISLSATSGTKDDRTLQVLFGGFYGLGKTRSAVIELSLSSGEKASLKVSQKANGLFLDFSGGNQPFTTEIPHAAIKSISTVLVEDTATDYTYSFDGVNYEFVFYSGSGYALIDGADGETCGIAWTQVSRAVGQGSWIKLPAVQGRTLVSVRAYTSNMGSTGTKRFMIGDEQPLDTTLPSKQHNLAENSVLANGHWAVLGIRDPQPATSYYLLACNGSLYFSKLFLEYSE